MPEVGLFCEKCGDGPHNPSFSVGCPICGYDYGAGPDSTLPVGTPNSSRSRPNRGRGPRNPQYPGTTYGTGASRPLAVGGRLPEGASQHGTTRETDRFYPISGNSSNTSFGIPDDFVEEFIRNFVTRLMSPNNCGAWVAAALETTPPDCFESVVAMTLREFSFNLGKVALTEPEKKATRFIRSHRLKIARDFRESIQRASMILRAGEFQMGDISEEPRVEGQHGDKGKEPPMESVSVREFITTKSIFREMISSLLRRLYYNREAKLTKIRDVILDGLDKKPARTISKIEISFFVDWDLPAFVEQQLYGQEEKSIGSLLTLTGSALYAQATSCAEYLRQNWTRSGPMFLTTLQLALASKDMKHEAVIDDSKVSIDLNGLAKISVKGSRKVVIEIAQQLAWIGASFHTAANGEVEYSVATIRKVEKGDEGLSFSIEFQSKSLLKEEKSCWHSLFNNPVIAQGFPILERGDELGLDLPIELMAALGGARHIAEFGGGLVLKGFSVLFVPVKIYENSIQWHMVSSKDENTRILYADCTRVPCRTKLEDLDRDLIHSKPRSFLGWCTQAETHLGTCDVDYGRLTYSTARPIRRIATVTGGTIGFSNIATAVLQFTLGPKDGKLHVSRRGPLEKVIQHAEGTPVTLYDTADKRAWLVPASNVLLHIGFKKDWGSSAASDGNSRLKPADFVLGCEAAGKALMDNSSYVLFNHLASEGAGYLFGDFILDQWSILEMLMENTVKMDAVPGKPIGYPIGAKIAGWEIMDLVYEHSPLQQKQACIHGTSGGWTQLARDIDAVILFGSGFQDVIRPVPGTMEKGCHKWKTVPKNHDYLTTTVSMLNCLYERSGCIDSKTKLTSSGLKWHCPAQLFEDCPIPTPSECACNRLQCVVKDTWRNDWISLGNKAPPGPVPANGAVIFGRASLFNHTFKTS